MTDEELAALEARLGRAATDEEKAAEVDRLLAVAEQAEVRAYLEEIVAVGKRRGFGLDYDVRSSIDTPCFTVDRRSEDGFAWGDERVLGATLDPASPYPSAAEREAVERRVEELLASTEGR